MRNLLSIAAILTVIAMKTIKMRRKTPQFLSRNQNFSKNKRKPTK
jgi:hypothetical protein